MSRQSIFTYPNAWMLINPTQIAILVEYFVKNSDIVLDADDAAALFKSRSVVTSPISKIFHKALETGDLEIVSPFRFRTGIHTINDVATNRAVTLDMLQAKEVVAPALAGAITSIPYLNDKILLNVTQFTRASGDVSDTVGLQSTVVRDLLCRLFYSDTRKTWMTPNLTQFVCKVYSMTLGTSVANWYNLDYKTQSIVTSLFAFFFLEQMSDAPTAVATLKTKWKYFLIPEEADLLQVLALIQNTLGKESMDSLEDVCAVVDALGIDRIRINRAILLTRLKSLGPDALTTGIALEYPPYFTYLILLVLSGSKIGLSYRLKGFNLMRDALAFVDDLVQTSNFLGSGAR